MQVNVDVEVSEIRGNMELEVFDDGGFGGEVVDWG